LLVNQLSSGSSNSCGYLFIYLFIDGVVSDIKRINAGVQQGSVLSPTLFLSFINDFLSLTKNPIYSFADDSTLCHSYSSSGRPTASVVARLRQNMESSLNDDLLKIVEWGKSNRVEFNATKIQCCLLTHKRIDGIDQRTNMAGVDVTQNNSLDILGMHLQSDLRSYI